AHSGIVILVIHTESDDVFSRREVAGQKTKRFRLRIDNPVFREYRPPVSRIDGDLCLSECRRLIGRLDSNAGATILDPVKCYRDYRWRVIDDERPALHLTAHREFWWI